MTILDLTGLDELVGCEWALREGIVLDAIGHHCRAEWSGRPPGHAPGLGARPVPAVRLERAPRHQGGPPGPRSVRRHRRLSRPRPPRSGAARARRPAPRHRRARQHGGPRATHRLPDRERPPPRLPARGGGDARLPRPFPQAGPARSCPSSRSPACSSPATGTGSQAGRAATGRRRPRPQPRRAGRDIEVYTSPGLVEVVVHADDDIDLELWGLRRKRELFERVFGCRLEVVDAQLALPLERGSSRLASGAGRAGDPPSCGAPATRARPLSTRTSPGRPRTRSPRMLRMISEVPPSMELARDRRNMPLDGVRPRPAALRAGASRSCRRACPPAPAGRRRGRRCAC